MKRLLLWGLALVLGLSAVTRAQATAPIPDDLKAALKSLASKTAADRAAALAAARDKGDARLIPLLDAYRTGTLELRGDQFVIYQSKRKVGDIEGYPVVDAFTQEPLQANGQPVVETKLGSAMVSAPRPERKDVSSVVSELQLLDPDLAKRNAAILEVADRNDPTVLPALKKQLTSAPTIVRPTLEEAIARLELTSGTLDEKIAAAEKLGKTGRNRVTSSLERIVAAQEKQKKLESALATLTEKAPSTAAIKVAIADIKASDNDAAKAAVNPLPAEPDAAALAAIVPTLRPILVDVQRFLGDQKEVKLYQTAESSLASIRSYQNRLAGVQHTFNGLSLGSIYVLLALGLAIIFGLMGVINMAHGEFMMIGAFTTYVVSSLFTTPALLPYYDWFIIVAIPAAFVVTAIVGWIVERTVIARLYGRPLESLLATFGVSLILVQLIRLIFGNNINYANPSWLQGGYEILPDLVLPLNRLMIIGICVGAVLLVWLVVNRTRFGLLLRATTQNRAMASSLGVSTKWVDGLTFAFGAGLAGIAGVAVPMFDKINPDMGSGYIVQSFLTVVAGGVGSVMGVVLTGCGLGFITKYVEPLIGGTGATIYGQILVLVLVVFFLQWRPAGLFPPKGRHADI